MWIVFFQLRQAPVQLRRAVQARDGERNSTRVDSLCQESTCSRIRMVLRSPEVHDPMEQIPSLFKLVDGLRVAYVYVKCDLAV